MWTQIGMLILNISASTLYGILFTQKILKPDYSFTTWLRLAVTICFAVCAVRSLRRLHAMNSSA